MKKRNRFRKVKQGVIKTPTKREKSSKGDSIEFAKKSDLFKAILTDSFMLLMPIIYTVIYLVFGSREGFRDNMLFGWIYILIPLIVAEVLFIKFAGQTPGMKAYNIKLISLDTKEKPSTVTLILRQLLSKVVPLTFLWLLNKESRNFQDYILNTAFVYDKNSKNKSREVKK
jgi:uncharacterized RDD family membrane protein YckC